MAKIKYFYTSNIGKCRKINQDNFYCNGVYMPSANQGTKGIKAKSVDATKHPLFAIFDGMGGEEAGEMAAYLAAEELSNFSFEEDSADLDEYCKQANNRICEYTKQNHMTSVGTTAAILRFYENQAELCNIGDSKIFLYSGGELNQLSYDHVGISVGGRKPPLTQNLGIEATELVIEPYVATGDYQPDDVFLICSDGLTDMVTEERIQELLNKKSKKAAAKALLKEALNNGGKDNVSFILIYAEKNSVIDRLKGVHLWQRM